ncbi:MAG TPA: IS630 family transposase [Anaeromyxobacteraceae bacterium]|nr:IS630 family transposase [Anaeromyxobacteraceae bacterium]
MPNIPRLDRAARRRLIQRSKKAKDPSTALRFLMIAKLGQGLSRQQVARDLQCAPSTVVSAAKRYQELGEEGLLDQRAGNGQPKVDERFLAELRTVLLGVPTEFGWQRPTWTRELLVLELERRGFPRVAVCTMGRALSAVGARLGAPKPTVLCPWNSERRKRKVAGLRRLARNATTREPVFYGDEMDVHLNPKIGRDWMLPGHRRYVVTPGQNKKRFVAGALNAQTRKLTWVEAPSKASDLFCKLVWKVAAEYRTAKRIHLIVDNYIIHSSKKTQRFLAQFGGRVVLHFLPPYCPDDNKIERVWLDLHANVTRNHRCKTIEELMVHVIAFMRAYNRREKLNPSLRTATPVRESRSVV